MTSLIDIRKMQQDFSSLSLFYPYKKSITISEVVNLYQPRR